MTQFTMLDTMRDGLNVVAARGEDTGGRTPLAWLDANGGLMPVEPALVYPALPPGGKYLYTRDEVLEAAGRMIVLPTPSEISAVTADHRTPKEPMRTSVRGAAKRAFEDAQGRG
ncbi:MAG: hypothetical protein ACRC8U_09755 [Brooklawnia sp.]